MRKKMFMLNIFFLLFLMTSCQTSSSKHESQNSNNTKTTEHKEYVVKDSNLINKPDWIDQPKNWGSSNDPDHMNNLYLLSMSEPKQNRTMACEVSKFNSMIELKSSILESYKLFFLNQMIPKDQLDAKWDKLEIMIEQKLNSLLKVSEVVRVYWEYRDYQRKLGALEDFKAYSCMTLIRISKNVLIKSIKDITLMILNSQENKDMFKVSQEKFFEVEQSIIRSLAI